MYQMIIKNEEYEGNNERVADLYFKRIGYTGPIDACEEVISLGICMLTSKYVRPKGLDDHCYNNVTLVHV